jgi:ankyrin repeat protein
LEGNTPCHTAAQNARAHNLLALVKAGANVNAVNSSGASVLHCVASMWTDDDLQRQALRLMLKRGADLRAIDSNGRTPLFGATPAATAIFFARGIDIDALDNRNRSACDRAATTRGASSLAMLIAAGASVDTDTFNKDAAFSLFGNFEESHWALLAAAGVRDVTIGDKASCQRCQRSGNLST